MDGSDLRTRLEAFANRLQTEPVRRKVGHPVDLAHLEEHLRQSDVALKLREYARAWRREAQFAAEYASTREQRVRSSYFAVDTRRKKDGHEKDFRGYAWAKKQLSEAGNVVRPRSRREDPFESEVIAYVWTFIRASVCPDYDFEIDKRVPALVDNLTAAYLRIQCPTLCEGITPDRIRRRPSMAGVRKA